MLKQGGKEVKEHNQFIEFQKFVACFEKKFTMSFQWFDQWNSFLILSWTVLQEGRI